MSTNDKLWRNLSRRQFLKLSATTAAALALAGTQTGAAAASSNVNPAHAPAMLIDISRCIGCGNCQRSCNAANNLHPTSEQLAGLSAQTFTFVQRHDFEGGKTRFVKRQCMHCLDAACASACPVAALYQTPEGPIAYRPDRCLGCRYCMVSCPFNIPRFEWDKGVTPEIRKCMFCIERQRAGKLPACAENCPTGALKVGLRGELLQEAHARISANPRFYVDHVYGEHEAGGTSMLYISDVPFALLGFRTDVTTRPVPAYTWDIMAKLPWVVGSLAVVLTGASIYTRRRYGGHHDDTPPWER
ncbi:MAG: 4Fe-4S dicluster domain-containing protein [Anaerolineae bacterium]|nr:4Fe-4S dicluster domain-containing protein [Anaerolineae bacterium]